jgi:hypothetical protein
MQLEKATSHSGQAALAGWISSNDVTLFTTVMVLAIAMFLHGQLSRGAKENVQISETNSTLAQRLTDTVSERDASNNLLSEARKSLNLTTEQRDRLQQQLVEKLADVSRLNAKLDVLLGEKGVLESQRQALAESKETISKEMAQLSAQRASLTKDRDSLKTTNAGLLQQVDSVTGQLANKVAALEQVEKERERLNKQASELDSIVTQLKQRLKKLNIDLANMNVRAETARADSQAKVEELKAQLAQRDKTTDEYLAKLKHATALFQGLSAEKEQLEQKFNKAEVQHQAELLEEGRNNRELVGLTGRLERVAVLFDASGSMRQAATSGGGDRWAEAQQIAGTWLKHLNVQRCVLIVFSSEVTTFPEDGSLADFRGEAGKTNRELLMKHLTEVTPGGWTDTYAALRKAYEYDIDSILLFSDGVPSTEISGVFDLALAERIYDLCRAHPNIPINTVGLGNYFDKNASSFLRTVAKTTKGTFRGQ